MRMTPLQFWKLMRKVDNACWFAFNYATHKNVIYIGKFETPMITRIDIHNRF